MGNSIILPPDYVPNKKEEYMRIRRTYGLGAPGNAQRETAAVRRRETQDIVQGQNR